MGSIRNKNNWNNASKRLFGSYAYSGIHGFPFQLFCYQEQNSQNIFWNTFRNRFLVRNIPYERALKFGKPNSAHFPHPPENKSCQPHIDCLTTFNESPTKSMSRITAKYEGHSQTQKQNTSTEPISIQQDMKCFSKLLDQEALKMNHCLRKHGFPIDSLKHALAQIPYDTSTHVC